MPTLAIDGRTLTANADATILDAARAAGIEIPTLCWYPKLPIVGNCRICLVSVDGQPKLLPACATKVADGMVVTTESHAAVENRRGVLRLLLERYPAEHWCTGSVRRPPRPAAASGSSAPSALTAAAVAKSTCAWPEAGSRGSPPRTSSSTRPTRARPA